LVTNPHVAQRNILFGSVLADSARRFRRQLKQRLDCSGGLRASAQLKNLSEQRQRHDDSGGFEIDADAAVLDERRRKDLRRESAGDAVDIRDRD
jgi:hypothetical protein